MIIIADCGENCKKKIAVNLASGQIEKNLSFLLTNRFACDILPNK